MSKQPAFNDRLAACLPYVWNPGFGKVLLQLWGG